MDGVANVILEIRRPYRSDGESILKLPPFALVRLKNHLVPASTYTLPAEINDKRLLFIGKLSLFGLFLSQGCVSFSRTPENSAPHQVEPENFNENSVHWYLKIFLITPLLGWN